MTSSSACSAAPLLLCPRLSSASPLSLSILASSLQLPWPGRLFRGLRTIQRDGGRPRVQQSGDPSLLRKPVISVDDENGLVVDKHKLQGEEEWVDWEDQILEDTVPLVGFVRMILHSGKYTSGDRLSAEHERLILERLLPYHPEYEKKIGCGIDYITIGYHPEFEISRCLFIVRKDGEMVDFSYWKCIKGLIRKNYPLYADSFILRHFRRRRRGDAP